jgi:uncharacterized protein YbjT (DUF2867 family)
MKIIITGATGMIGKGVLLECLDHKDVTSVLTVGRTAPDLEHAKLKHLVHHDLLHLSSIEDLLLHYDACFYCLGVSAGGMSEAAYTEITYEYTLSLARTLQRLNPTMTFIYVSGEGTDSTEKGQMMWARVKGKTENHLMDIGFKKAIMFRPGLIVPLRGIRSRTPAYRFMYSYFGWLVSIIKWLAPHSVTDTTRIGLAMINAVKRGKDQSILRPADINALAED